MPLRLGIALEISAKPFTDEKPEEKPFTCNICQRQFTLMGVLKAHFQRTHPDKPFKSSYSVSDTHAANSSQKSNEARKSALNLFAKKATTHKCVHCQKDFPKKIDLIKHQFNHKNERPPFRGPTTEYLYQCDACKQKFYSRQSFKSHYSVQCELCTDMHCRTWVLTKEMCPEDEGCLFCKRILCERCHNLHITEKKNYVRKPEEPQECILCKEVFESKQLLKNHYAVFHKLKNVM